MALFFERISREFVSLVAWRPHAILICFGFFFVFRLCVDLIICAQGVSTGLDSIQVLARGRNIVSASEHRLPRSFSWYICASSDLHPDLHQHLTVLWSCTLSRVEAKSSYCAFNPDVIRSTLRVCYWTFDLRLNLWLLLLRSFHISTLVLCLFGSCERQPYFFKVP